MTTDRLTPSGRALAAVTVVPPIVIAAWLIVSFPLLLVDAFHPAITLALFVPMAGALLYGCLRALPGVPGATPWSLVGLVVVAVGFGIAQGLAVSEQIVVRRDAASYAQFTTWLGEHGGLPIPTSSHVFGDVAGLSYESPAFYERSGVILPQFMAGLPLTLAPGHWLAGIDGLLLGAPALGAAGVLTFGGLVARLVGAKWAWVAALALGLSWPVLFVSRSTYSEALALVLIIGGLSLLVDGFGGDARAGPRRGAMLAGVAGVVLGLEVLVRIDGLRDVLPVVPFAGLLIVQHRQARRSGRSLASPPGLFLLGGLAIGAAYGLADGYLLSWPYLDHLRPHLVPLFLICGVVAGLTVIGVTAGCRFGLPELSRTRVPAVGAVVVVLGVIGFAVRPLVQTVRDPEGAPAYFTSAVQRIEGLPVDGTRMYYENSLYWVIWYVGLPTLILATFGAAVLVRSALRGRAPRWTPVVMLLLWSVATLLWYPGITPDHPWASRRLAPTVVPAMILFATWAAAYLVRRSQVVGWPSPVPRAIAGVAAVAIALPPLMTSGPLKPQRDESFRLAGVPIERGEVAAVRGVCRELPRRAAVIFIEPNSFARFGQVVRGMCGVPTAQLMEPTPDVIDTVASRVRNAGRVPILASERDDSFANLDTEPPVLAIDLVTRQDTYTLERPPAETMEMRLALWLAEPR